MKSLHYYISSTMSEQAQITQDVSNGNERITVNLPTANFMIYKVDFDSYTIIIFNRKSGQFHEFNNMSIIQTLGLMEVPHEILI